MKPSLIVERHIVFFFSFVGNEWREIRILRESFIIIYPKRKSRQRNLRFLETKRVVQPELVGYVLERRK